MTSGHPENPRMTPNRQSPAYALFARRPIVPQPPDVLAADPPASQEPPPPSGTEDTAECSLPAPVAAASAPILKRPRRKAAAADSQSVPIAQSSLQIDPSAAVRRADIFCLTGVQHRPVEWLWQERLASGTLAMLSADVGAGKTWIALAIAAAGCGMAQGKAVAAACEGIARNPQAAGNIRTTMIIGLALIEALVIYVLVAAFALH